MSTRFHVFLKSYTSSFSFALQGISIAWREERQFRVESWAAACAIALSFALNISHEEFLAVIAVIGLVLTAELFNTALEELCDKFQSEHDPHIGKIKDLSAAAVLAASGAAALTGIFIFLPHMLPSL